MGEGVRELHGIQLGGEDTGGHPVRQGRGEGGGEGGGGEDDVRNQGSILLRDFCQIEHPNK